MQIYGYHRTSTKEQHLDRGIQEIERYCNEHEMALTNIFTDQETGKNFNRPRYTVLVEDVLRPGDILIVTELDRLGRNKHDTMQQIQRIKDMGVRLMVLELPGCITCGETIERAVENAADAKKAWLEAALEEGIEIHEPGSLEEYSGQFKIRMPRSLHRDLAEHSKKEGISMNQYCIYLLSKNDALLVK